jgi:hypothetical protein
MVDFDRSYTAADVNLLATVWSIAKQCPISLAASPSCGSKGR